jgi:NAD(P)H dehydrogenase (quinone)
MIVVTAASGQLGRLVVDELLRRIPASDLAIVVRDPDKVADLAARGVQVRRGDYAKPDTLASALTGATKLLMISSSEMGQRAPQHRNVVDAAKKANVGLLAYTSILRAESSKMKLAAEHLETEQYIQASGLPFVFLRNGWYFENHTATLGSALAHGAILGAAASGRFASAARKDYADAAVAALLEKAPGNRIYELAGANPFTLTDLAAEVTKQSGKTVVYRDMPAAQYAEALVGFGLPAFVADVLADCDVCAANGELDGSSTEMRRLLGRPTSTLAEAVTAGLSTAATA